MADIILHSDLNCFYASVEMNENPALKGKAVAVCGSTEDRHGIVLTMHVNETIAGFAAFYCNDTVTKQAFLSLLAVLPEYRQQKIGQKLLSAAISRAQQAHMDRFVLEVQRENLPAIAFYEKNRFSFTDKETVHSRFMMLPLNK